MDKLGVDESLLSDDKTATNTDACPWCGAKLERHGNLLVCPTHGTEPFEEPA